jgi:hypothetical protein
MMLTPAQRRRIKLAARGIIGQDRRDFREGIPWRGLWVTPDEMHKTAAARCRWFDQQMKSVRNYINRNGAMPNGPLADRVRE